MRKRAGNMFVTLKTAEGKKISFCLSFSGFCLSRFGAPCARSLAHCTEYCSESTCCRVEQGNSSNGFEEAGIWKETRSSDSKSQLTTAILFGTNSVGLAIHPLQASCIAAHLEVYAFVEANRELFLCLRRIVEHWQEPGPCVGTCPTQCLFSMWKMVSGFKLSFKALQSQRQQLGVLCSRHYWKSKCTSWVKSSRVC